MNTLRVLGGRLAGSAFVLFVVSVVTFAIFQLLPRLTKIDIAYYYTGRNTSPAQAAAVAEKFGFDQPVPEQFWTWLSGIFTGRDLGDGVTAVHCAAPCLGYSFRQNRPVTEMILHAFPVTASITIGAAVLWLLAGIGSGVLAAHKQGSVTDRTLNGVSLIGASVPEFFTGMVLIYLLTAGPSWLRLFPDGIHYVPFTENPARWALMLLPAWCCLAFLLAAFYLRLTRSTLLETAEEDYMLTASAKGLSPMGVLGRHGLRAAVPTLVTVAGLDLGTLLGGVVIIESLFSFPGLGRMAYDAIASKDLPVIMGVTLFSAVLIVLANAVVDLFYAVLDPRVRRG